MADTTTTTTAPAGPAAVATVGEAGPAGALTGSVSWFEIGSPDPAAAQRFYGELFGWTFAAMDVGVPYVDITTGQDHPIKGGIADTSRTTPGHATFCVVVEDVAATLTVARDLGGEVVVGPLALASGLVVGYLRDRDGNLIAVYAPPVGKNDQSIKKN